MAKRQIFVSDFSGTEIPEGKGVKVRISFADARVGDYEADLTEAEGKELSEKARKVARRGRKPAVQEA